MIRNLKLKNFRNFSDKEFLSFSDTNFIIGDNGKGKTNTLESIALLGNNSLLDISLDELVKLGEDYFYIQLEVSNGDIFSLYYDKNTKKKTFKHNTKKVTSKQFYSLSYKCVVFSPIVMNMLYLSPSLRRSFLDIILISCFPEFSTIKKSYNKIVRSRNSTLKAVNQLKAQESEIEFWDNKFVELATSYYMFRFQIVDFIAQHINKIDKFINFDSKSIDFSYITKVNKNTITQDLQNYLIKNRQRDIILGKTHIGPHIDDFEILIGDINLANFASRGEVKSVIIYLKLLEGIFIENTTKRKPLLLIDDLYSELDDYHKEILLENISYYQTFISNIKNVIATGKDFIIQ